jgi:hypothetical protein
LFVDTKLVFRPIAGWLFCIGLIFLTPLLFSCGQKRDEQRLGEDSSLLAKLYCEAKTLRIQRFELADQIRFEEDKPEGQGQMGLSSRLDSLKQLISPLADQTKILADSINALQQRFYQQAYYAKEKRKLLDQAFQKRIEEICPE